MTLKIGKSWDVGVNIMTNVDVIIWLYRLIVLYDKNTKHLKSLSYNSDRNVHGKYSAKMGAVSNNVPDFYLHHDCKHDKDEA